MGIIGTYKASAAECYLVLELSLHALGTAALEVYLLRRFADLSLEILDENPVRCNPSLVLCPSSHHHRDLGPINIRGRSELSVVHRIDWQEDVTASLTVPAALMAGRHADSNFGQIELSWLDVRSMFRTEQLPIHLGRVDDAEFVVNDPRVSRLHARIELRQGSCVLTDLSTYGTWVRFHGNAGPSSEIALRREECVLHGSGEIGLGAPLSDFSAPTIAFNTMGGDVLLSRRTVG